MIGRNWCQIRFVMLAAAVISVLLMLTYAKANLHAQDTAVLRANRFAVDRNEHLGNGAWMVRVIILRDRTTGVCQALVETTNGLSDRWPVMCDK